MLKKSAHFLTRTLYKAKEAYKGVSQVCINIGCGQDIKPYWLNCDLEPIKENVKNFDIKCQTDLAWLSTQAASLINCDHVIGYLNIAQAELFFSACYAGLKEGGTFTLEFPSLQKLLHKLSGFDYLSQNVERRYIEIIRAIYAYDYEDAKTVNFSKQTYITGWTEDFLKIKLIQAGFSQVKILEPKTHGSLIDRDTRVEAVK